VVILICKEHRKAVLLRRLYFYFGDKVEWKWYDKVPNRFICESVVLVDGKEFMKGNYFVMNSPFYNVCEESNPLSAWEWHRALSFYLERYVTGQKLNKKGLQIQRLTSSLFLKNHIFLATLISLLFRYLVLRKILFVVEENSPSFFQPNSFNDVYVLGTGESIKKFDTDNIDNDAAVIVCNTIVKNKPLFTKLNPTIVVAGDALYHFSDELFSRNFQDDLQICLNDNPDTIFIYPQVFECFMVRTFGGSNCSQLKGIPILNEKKVDSLRRSFSLPRYGNSFNLLSFPVAKYLVRNNIYFVGYDGKGKEDENFWKNQEDIFYTEEANILLENNKAFRKHFLETQNYSKRVFGDGLESRMNKVEKSGINLVTLFPSYTDAFKKRYHEK